MNKMLGQAWLDGGPSFLQQNGLELAQAQVVSHSDQTTFQLFYNYFHKYLALFCIRCHYSIILLLATDAMCRMLL
jgi:hypothetical protein